VFRKVPVTPTDSFGCTSIARAAEQQSGDSIDRLRAEAFATSPVAQIVITSDGVVALANRQAESLLGVSSRDVGRPFRDLEVSYRPVELRRHIDQTQLERRSTQLDGIDYARSVGELLCLDIQIDPLINTDSGLLGVTLMFRDVTEQRRLREQLEVIHRQLETAYEELQSTNEELETTNEELQSTVEELETTNEELQSTNEELETMNEELHSTNDELQTANDTIRESAARIDSAHSFLEQVLASLRSGVAVLDRDLLVRVWNRRARDLWGLRGDETDGQHFFNLEIGLPTDQLRPLIRSALQGAAEPQELQLSAIDRRGRTIELRVTCTAMRLDASTAPGGVVLIMEECEQPTA
jgi:two-component system CheB/CheR fusion protein